MEIVPKNLARALHLLLLAAAVFLFAQHFRHLQADFPNASPWMDWSKYTDEGWYGDAAIRHFQLGHWNVPGDFNPAAALPVWPLVEAAMFHFTGVSLVAVRALALGVFACILMASWLLIERWRLDRTRLALSAPVALLLLTASPFCFVFFRMGILEPMLILVMLMCLLAAGLARGALEAHPTPNAGAWLQTVRANIVPIVLLGLLIPTLILTKTTGMFLLPAIAYLLWASCAYQWRPFLRIGIPAAMLAALVWGTYFFAVIRPHYLLDYRYLFSANGYNGTTWKNFPFVIAATIADGMWMGKLLYPLAWAAAILTVVLAGRRGHRLRATPLVPTLLLWAVGYNAFLAYHDNLQPRYYLVVAVPLTLLFPLAVEQLVLPLLATFGRRRFLQPAAVLLTAALVCAIVVSDAKLMFHFIRHPDYTLLNAARGINAYIRNDQQDDPAHNPLLLSISGSDISLMTGLPSICDDFGTLELPDRVKLYKPGWYAAWNQLDDDKMDAIAPQFSAERVAEFPSMDDPERNLLILYKLEPATGEPHPKRKRKPTPRQLRTRVGQQPSTNQLEH